MGNEARTIGSWFAIIFFLSPGRKLRNCKMDVSGKAILAGKDEHRKMEETVKF